MAALLLLAAFLLLAVVLFYKKRTLYWKRRGIPGPEPSLVVGNLLHLLNYNFPGVLQLREWTKKYGKCYGIQEGWNNVLVVSNVDMLQELFVKKFECFHGRKLFSLAPDPDTEPIVNVFDARGARWKRLRNMSNSSFTVNHLKKVMPTVQHSVDVMVEFLNEKADKGESFDIHPFYQELTMDVIERIAMGQKGSRQFQNPFIDDVKGVFTRKHDLFFTVTPVAFPFLKNVVRKLLWSSYSFKEMLDKFFRTVGERKEARDRGEREELDEFGNARVDFIDVFLDAECDEVHEESEFIRSGQKVEKKLTMGEVVSQCLVFLLAGFDTTANSLAYVTFCLAKNPSIQRRLQEEIEKICSDGEITYDQLQKLSFMDKVVKETLRLYPLTSFASSRLCMKSTTLGNIKVRKGDYVQADVFSVHYDDKLWPNPEKFDPDRWNSDEKRHPSLGYLLELGRECASVCGWLFWNKNCSDQDPPEIQHCFCA
ncbi:hypothetical protein L596_023363 [Steinernema carpocapsae]|uniref:Cytochrome P450 n=2 Tax=Steinernema carpocapsae TaxID=34508 RepID=A0A4U5MDE6_STECR|nr:hypothetical protein L596_023363 [Steinernema carpocapsae]